MALCTQPIRSTSAAGLDRSVVRDVKVLGRFIQLWCCDHHGDRERSVVTAGGEVGKVVETLDVSLCGECRGTFLHGASRRVLCPLDPKPACKHCPTPCYRPGHRELIRRIMGYAGRRMILRGRMDYLAHYFF